MVSGSPSGPPAKISRKAQINKTGEPPFAKKRKSTDMDLLQLMVSSLISTFT